MKKIIFTIFALLLFSAGFIKAQSLDTIPNGNFERWKAVPNNANKEIPQGWDTLGGEAYGVTEVDYTKNAQLIIRPVYDGKYALALSSEARNGNLYFGIIRTKFAMKYRDAYLNMNMGYFEGTAPQTPVFGILMWNSKTHDTVINGIAVLPTNNNYANDTMEPWHSFSIGLTYKTGDATVPDSGEILLRNCALSTSSPASVLYIEKMWFDNAQATGIYAEASIGNNVSVYPNPFKLSTTIHYNLTLGGEVNLTVYDMQGKAVSTLVNGNQTPGTYDAHFDARGLPAGMYVYKLQTSSGVETGKMILSK